jgi:glycine betaine/proline transport system ATP-binding protein
MSIANATAATVISADGHEVGSVSMDQLIRCLVGDEAAASERTSHAPAAALLSAIE